VFLNAYYFRAHMYTLVPRHVREDMEWMADIGTDAVTIGVLEQDLTAAVENIQIVHREAERAGLPVNQHKSQTLPIDTASQTRYNCVAGDKFLVERSGAAVRGTGLDRGGHRNPPARRGQRAGPRGRTPGPDAPLRPRGTRRARRFGAAEALREATGFPVPPIERAAYNRRLDATPGALDQAGYAAVWVEGRAMAQAQAIAYAQTVEHPAPRGIDGHPLLCSPAIQPASSSPNSYYSSR
jgi:hypothetical protein